MDFCSAFCLALILLPLFSILLVYIGIRLRCNPLFKQERLGYLEKPFNLYKLRTLALGWEPIHGNPTKDLQFLRDTGLDEIPQLWNVMIGEMSIIGPRPLLIEYLPLYSHLQKRRHLVRPGILGLAQIKGGNALSWKSRIEYDLEYLNKQSWSMDISILFFYLKGAYRTDRGIMSPPFKGDN